MFCGGRKRGLWIEIDILTGEENGLLVKEVKDSAGARKQ